MQRESLYQSFSLISLAIYVGNEKKNISAWLEEKRDAAQSGRESLECDLRSVEVLSGLFDFSSVLELQERTKKDRLLFTFCD